MKIVYNRSTEPYFNLALEEHLLCETQEEYILLWRNSPAIIVGRNQNTLAEINYDFVKSHDLPVVRRLTGGGAVFHDLGNVNYTFIVNDSGSFNNYAHFCRPVIAALASLGVTAELSGRNDMLIDGKKFSGNAQCAKHGRVMHHGTLMLSSNVSDMTAVLKVNPLKIQSKGIKSVRSRVTNISEQLEKPITPEEFIAVLLDNLRAQTGAEIGTLTAEDIEKTTRLVENRYSLWEWNYGYQKEFTVRKESRLDCGYFDARLIIEQDKIVDFRLYGDYFINGEISEVEQALVGVEYNPKALEKAAQALDIGKYLPSVSPTVFAELLM